MHAWIMKHACSCSWQCVRSAYVCCAGAVHLSAKSKRWYEYVDSVQTKVQVCFLIDCFASCLWCCILLAISSYVQPAGIQVRYMSVLIRIFHMFRSREEGTMDTLACLVVCYWGKPGNDQRRKTKLADERALAWLPALESLCHPGFIGATSRDL